MSVIVLAAPESDAQPNDGSTRESRPVDAALVRQLVLEHHGFVFRLLARLGTPEGELDDAVQQVFLVLTQKRELRLVAGSERSFLFGVALRVAHTLRRSRARHLELPVDFEATHPADDELSPDLLTDQKRARQVLDLILNSLPFELRTVFILFELEDMPVAEIASALGVPTGTVSSRLRRAREFFAQKVERLRIRQPTSEGLP